MGHVALFSGPSGSGKTLQAEIVAKQLGLELFRQDLAKAGSKYIGETEKNLGRIFDAAEKLPAVLFFDEADALFGTRTEVKDSSDKYANIDNRYILQRLETFQGVAILTTNSVDDVEPAFLRRMDVCVEFPLAKREPRLREWVARLKKLTD